MLARKGKGWGHESWKGGEQEGMKWPVMYRRGRKLREERPQRRAVGRRRTCPMASGQDNPWEHSPAAESVPGGLAVPRESTCVH